MLTLFFENSFSLKNHPRISGTAFSVLFSVKAEFWPNPGRWEKQKDMAVTVLLSALFLTRSLWRCERVCVCIPQCCFLIWVIWDKTLLSGDECVLNFRFM